MAAAEAGAVVGDRELLASIKFQRDSAAVELELVREQLAARKLEVDAKNRALAEAQARAAPVAEAGLTVLLPVEEHRALQDRAEQATVYHENNRSLRCVCPDQLAGRRPFLRVSRAVTNQHTRHWAGKMLRRPE